ncbi:polyketide synthase PksN [Anaerobacterium chartisolvens]|uniref:Polyketide synthase PksN n=1 Tax=Anaerobacterium chartisolvens TaxID=1297424 RepID=A0A369B4A3_9FIRM|nr:type I polyketide synthase [Anaerobacterium chartisolvens]RCX16313.1 polyketide synthase PksN [Anaerobacterium chartisolvens]
MEQIKKFIYEKIANKELSHERAKEMLMELQDKNTGSDEPIAIIGADGRFANADNLEDFWTNLRNGLNCIGDFPTERIKDSITHLYSNPCYCEFVEGGPIDEKDYYNKGIYAKGSYLNEIDKFDADFFDIPPREAKYMDPHQRVFLEVAFGAIENAGYSRKKIAGTKTGVFLGKENTNISFYKNMSKADALQLTGSWESITVSRLNYFLNLKGPAMMIDAACSSGLISVHMACESIHRGECDMAVAGGICLNILAPQDVHKDGKDLSSVEATDFLVKTFDKNAGGTVWGEGVGIVLLKPLSKAVKDRDNIHAVIKSSVINNDGTSSGIIAPDAASQEELIIKAWEKAKIRPETISYIEAHGTGTVLGDPIEFKGLTNAFRRHTKNKQFCGIGSLKTSLGHLVAASGMASLFKVVFALKNAQIPPSINFNYPNPYINFCDSPLYITDRLTEWNKQDDPRRAGISSFGFSGTNCHVILEEYIKPQEEEQEKATLNCLTISAKNENSAINFVDKYRDFVNKSGNISLEDMCYSANTGKDHYAHRLAVIFSDREELVSKLDSIISSGLGSIKAEDCYYQAHKIISKKSGAASEGYIDETEQQELTDMADRLIKEHINDGNAGDGLRQLCKLYIKGADIDWDKMYLGQQRCLISVPNYPMDRTRHWTESKVSKIKSRQLGERLTHPLVEHRLINSIDESIYSTEFAVDKHWVLSDHKIMNNCVIPGTTYLEMARAAASFTTGSDRLELRDVFFITPLMVDEGDSVKVHTVIRHIRDDKYGFTIASLSDKEEEGRWLKNCEGTILVLEEDDAGICSLDEIKASSAEVADYSGKGQENTFGVFSFGQRWANVVTAYHGDNEALVELVLADDIAADLDTLELHPGMLDNAMNYMSQSSENNTYLPFTYKSFKSFAPMEKRTYSHIRRKAGKTENAETVNFDITLLSENGAVLCEVTDYVIKRVDNVGAAISAGSDSKIDYFEMIWEQTALAQSHELNSGDSILIFKGACNAADSVVNKLRQSFKLVEVEYGGGFERVADDKYMVGDSDGDYQRLFNELKDYRFNRIIHSFAWNGNEVETAGDLKHEQSLGVYSMYHLVRAAVASKIKPVNGITVLADYVNEVDGSEETIKPHNAALFGISKVVGLEYEHLGCKLIDVDGVTDAGSIVNEILADDGSSIVSLRNNKRYMEKLAAIEKEQLEQKPLELKENGVYVITGGTGGLGLAMARYIASQAKARLCLVSRTKTADRQHWKSISEGGSSKEAAKIKELCQLEEAGSQVFCYSASVYDEGGMKEVIASIIGEHGGIDGIIHCAGVAGNGFIINRNEDVFAGVIEPKTTGTLLLDILTREAKPEFFVLFSTITSLTGDPGQGDYTAAGCYMDSFSFCRNKRGMRTVTINWPIWSETGMAVEYGATDDYTIFKSLDNQRAFEAFSVIAGSSKCRVIPGKINYKYLAVRKDSITFNMEDSIRKALSKEVRRMEKDSQQSGGRKVVEVSITGKPMEELTEIERVLIQIWAQVLDVGKLDVYDDFQTVGGDSILTAELLKAINDEYPDVMDISDIYYYNTIVSMAEYIDGIINSR